MRRRLKATQVPDVPMPPPPRSSTPATSKLQRCARRFARRERGGLGQIGQACKVIGPRTTPSRTI
eukprot:6076689-Alexandrium_andersonii.AAC.1